MVITIFPTFAYQKKTDLLVGGGVCTEITSRSITLSALTICVSAANCGQKCTRNQESYNYVEIGDVDVGTGSVSFNAICTENLPDNAKILTRAGDLLASTVRPNRGAVAILESDNLLVSGAFTVLRESGDYPEEVLQVLLRTSMYRDWLLRFNVGTSYPVIKDEDVLNMPIPILGDDIKQDVVAKVNESASLRRQSKQLLEYAKQAVEMAIEQGEDAALVWLKERSGE